MTCLYDAPFLATASFSSSKLSSSGRSSNSLYKSVSTGAYDKPQMQRDKTSVYNIHPDDSKVGGVEKKDIQNDLKERVRGKR